MAKVCWLLGPGVKPLQLWRDSRRRRGSKRTWKYRVEGILSSFEVPMFLVGTLDGSQGDSKIGRKGSFQPVLALHWSLAQRGTTDQRKQEATRRKRCQSNMA
jgi:hypothetical protein